MKTTLILATLALGLVGCNAGPNTHLVVGWGTIKTTPTNVTFTSRYRQDPMLVQKEVFRRACPNRASSITPMENSYYQRWKDDIDEAVEEIKKRPNFCNGKEQ